MNLQKIQIIFEEKYAKEFWRWEDLRTEDDDFHIDYQDFGDYWAEVLKGFGCVVSDYTSKNHVCVHNPDEENPDSFVLVPKHMADKILVLGDIP